MANAYKKINKDDNIIFNGAVKVYFPYILNIDGILIIMKLMKN